jgi:ketosteroid isomerase-like protein
MVEAERAFARTALEKGVRDAFVEFFAADSFGFYPTPMNAREFYRSQPPTPLTRRLEWEPRLGDIARSEELGWLTGPFTSSDTTGKAPTRHGCYFSIWRKQPGGDWKVLMDVGIPTPEPVTFAHEGFRAVDEPATAGATAAPARADASGDATVERADQALAAAIARDGIVAAYGSVLTPVSRLHVPGRQPLVGRDAILDWLRGSQRHLACTTTHAEVAKSADLGFARGDYEETRAGTSDGEGMKGHYVRMWKRRGAGPWTMAVEVRSPLPPAAKP